MLFSTYAHNYYNRSFIDYCIIVTCIANSMLYWLTSDKFNPFPNWFHTISDIRNNPLHIRTLSAPAPNPLKKYGLGYGVTTIHPNPVCFHS